MQSLQADQILFKYGDDGGTFSDSLSWKTFIALHLVVQMKSDSDICVKNEKKERSSNPGSLLTSAQLKSSEVGVKVGLLVWETYKGRFR